MSREFPTVFKMKWASILKGSRKRKNASGLVVYARKA